MRQLMPSGLLSDAWKTMLIKDRINASSVDTYKQRVPEFEQFLLDEITTIKPKLLIPMGEVSFRWLTGLENIRKFRGSVLLTRGDLLAPAAQIKVLPILGPNPYLNQAFDLRWVTQIDCAKIPRFLNDDPPPEQNLNIWIARNTTSLRNFLDRSFKLSGLLVFDIETFLGIPTCISFCFDGNESVCIPFLDRTISFEERMLMAQLCARVLASDIRKVNQNIKYDWRCLERFNMQVNNVVGDTMLSASLINPEFSKNLGFLNSIYTDIPYFKDEGREFDPAKHKREQFYLYNAKDSLSTYRIYEIQEREIEELNLTYCSNSLTKLIPIYKTMEDNGLRYDDEIRQKLTIKYNSLYSIQCLKLETLCGQKINPQSPLQVSKMIFDEMGYEKSRQVTGTDEESLEHLMVFGHPKRSIPARAHQVLTTILNCRKIHKVIEYLETVPYPDGRWRCHYNLAGTETGRTSAERRANRHENI